MTIQSDETITSDINGIKSACNSVSDVNVQTDNVSQAGCISVKDAESLSKEYSGLKAKSIKNLEEDLDYQHNHNGSKSDLGHESVIIASHLTSAEKTWDPLQALYNTMDITFTRVGGILVNNDGISSGFDDNVSYRGDIKSGIKQASNQDLEADVDADNISFRVRKSKSVHQAMDTMTQYNTGIADGSINRKKEFLKNHGGWDSVKEKIDSWTPEDIMLSEGTTQGDIEAAKESFKDYLNTKRTGFEALFN